MTEQLVAEGNPVGGGRVRSVERVVAILGAIGDRPAGLSVAEVVRATGLAKTTVLRLVFALEGSGLLRQQVDRRYVLGPRLLRWADAAALAWQVPAEVTAAMGEAVSACGETMHLYVRDGTRRVCVARADAARSLRHMVRVGDTLPLWAGGVSKILLSDVPAALVAEVAATSPAGLAALPGLVAAVEQSRRDGFATSEGELEPGLSSVAVAIRDEAGRVVAAVSFGGPTSRFAEIDRAVFVGHLRSVAEIAGVHRLVGWRA
ncbi:MAG: IclR family transcriptional regulator [Acidimicrobiales bacterium]